MKKEHLPQKLCVVCERPFSWRRKWLKCWEDVKYCSERCRRSSRKTPPNICAAGSVEDEF